MFEALKSACTCSSFSLLQHVDWKYIQQQFVSIFFDTTIHERRIEPSLSFLSHLVLLIPMIDFSVHSPSSIHPSSSLLAAEKTLNILSISIFEILSEYSHIFRIFSHFLRKFSILSKNQKFLRNKFLKGKYS